MSIDINWIQAVTALVFGFLLKVLFDELKSARLRIVGVSKLPFSIGAKYKVIGTGFDNYYTAYRIRVENQQKRYMNCAAENCIAWLELDYAPEPYQICWVGDFADVTINVGDVREVDFCARGNTTGKIYAPTQRGYFELSPREIGDGKSELRGKLRITSKNGKKAERRFVIKPNNNQLEISAFDEHAERNEATVSNNQEPLSFKPLPWGVLFFCFWTTLRIVDSPTLLMKGVAWFFLALSGILLLSVFSQPLFPILQRILAKYIPRLSRIVTSENASWFFVSLVFFTTLIGFPTNIIMNWSKLQVIDVSISVIGLVCWIIAYLLVLVSITSRRGRVGQILSGVISALIIWSAINAFQSNVLAGWILIGIGVVSIIIVIKKPKSWDLRQMV